MYDASDHVAAIHGRDTHCNNVGPVHRLELDPILRRWFGIALPDEERRRRRRPEELNCLTPEIIARRGLQPVHQLAASSIDTSRGSRRFPTDRLRGDLAKLLGIVSAGEPRVISQGPAKTGRELVQLKTEDGIEILPASEFAQRLWNDQLVQ